MSLDGLRPGPANYSAKSQKGNMFGVVGPGISVAVTQLRLLEQKQLKAIHM